MPRLSTTLSSAASETPPSILSCGSFWQRRVYTSSFDCESARLRRRRMAASSIETCSLQLAPGCQVIRSGGQRWASSRRSAAGLGRDQIPHTQFFGGHARAFHAIPDLLEGDLACIIRRAVIWLFVDAERRKSAVIRRTQALFRYEVGSAHERISHFL